MKIRLGELRQRIREYLVESQVYVDEHGYAHDDEGNTWFAGRGRRGTYKGTSFGRSFGYGGSQRPLTTADPNPKLAAAVDALSAKLPNNNFVASIRSQLRRGSNLSKKQRDVIAKIMRQAGMGNEAQLFSEQAWPPGRYYPAAEPLDGPDRDRLNQPLGEQGGEQDDEDLDEVDTDPSNNPGRPADAFDYIGMRPKSGAAMAHPFAAGGGGVADPSESPDD